MKTAHHLVATFILTFLIVSTATVEAQFNYITNNGTITITGYTGPGGAVPIPDKINGLPITSIGDGAFSWCTSLTVIEVDPANLSYSSLDGVLFNKSQTVLIQYPGGKTGAYTIPNSVTSIGNYAFSGCSSVTNVTIGNSVTSIGSYAFSYCSSLSGITIPDSVTTIGGRAFSDCTSLTSITIPNSVTNWGVVWLSVVHLPHMGSSTFGGCTSLTNVTIAGGVPFIGSYAFYGCTSLTSVTIPNSVTNIGDCAFAGCISLTNVNIPDSVTSIGNGALERCWSLTTAYFEGNAPSDGVNIFYDANTVTVYYLPGTTGWSPTFGGRPTALWVLPQPIILTAAGFGVQPGGYGFRISWATNVPVVVEVSTTLANPLWSPVSTNTLIEGWSDFRDPEWTNYPSRFYRARRPID